LLIDHLTVFDDIDLAWRVNTSKIEVTGWENFKSSKPNKLRVIDFFSML